MLSVRTVRILAYTEVYILVYIAVYILVYIVDIISQVFEFLLLPPAPSLFSWCCYSTLIITSCCPPWNTAYICYMILTWSGVSFLLSVAFVPPLRYKHKSGSTIINSALIITNNIQQRRFALSGSYVISCPQQTAKQNKKNKKNMLQHSTSICQHGHQTLPCHDTAVR